MHQRVVIVEDNRAVRILLAQVLRNQGYAIAEAGSGEEALRLVTAAPPALLVVDQHLPGLSGAELIRLLRSSTVEQLRRVPVVGLSGRPGSERDLLAAGACAFVRKPFGQDELLRSVQACLAPGAAGARVA